MSMSFFPFECGLKPLVGGVRKEVHQVARDLSEREKMPLRSEWVIYVQNQNDVFVRFEVENHKREIDCHDYGIKLSDRALKAIFEARVQELAEKRFKGAEEQRIADEIARHAREIREDLANDLRRSRVRGEPQAQEV